MQFKWNRMFIACGMVALSISACLPNGSSTPFSYPHPTGISSENTPTPIRPDDGETLTTATPAALPEGFQVDKTLAPEPAGQEEIVKNTRPTVNPEDSAHLKWVQQARDDLSRRLGIPSDQIDLVEFESVVWPDGSLGCPQPGMAYTQVMVDGLLLRFQAQGIDYEYHSGGNRQPFLCEKPSSR